MKKHAVIRSLTFTVICLLLGVVIALQLKSINSAQSVMLAENRRVEDLSQELVSVMNKNSELLDRIDELTIALRKAESETVGQESQIQHIINERDTALVFAGMTDVSGPGGVITLISGPETVVRDSDLRMIVNYLRATTAQAISINGERLVAMSEIVQAGSHIAINGKSYASNGQFEIRVIMKENDFISALTLLQGTLNNLKANGIDVVHVTMDPVEISRLREDSPAYRLDLLQGN